MNLIRRCNDGKECYRHTEIGCPFFPSVHHCKIIGCLQDNKEYYCKYHDCNNKCIEDI